MLKRMRYSRELYLVNDVLCLSYFSSVQQSTPCPISNEDPNLAYEDPKAILISLEIPSRGAFKYYVSKARGKDGGFMNADVGTKHCRF